MNAKLENKLANLSSYLAGAVIVLAPIWAFVSVALASVFGHYTIIRLVIELALVVLMLAAASLLALDRKLATNLLKQKWLVPLAAFILLEIIWGIVAHFTSQVSLKALGYAWIVDTRYLLFFVVSYLLAMKSGWLAASWRWLIFIPAIVVSVFAVLQFAVLPLNFLHHFGYSSHTIFPYETINHNTDFRRAFSFTRGANQLGAYALIIASLAALALARTKRKLFYGTSLIPALAALAFSFSRSAWLGTIVSLILLAILIFTSARARKILIASALALIIIAGILFASLHNNPRFQNYFTHYNKDSTSKTTSDQQHASALADGLNDFASDPLGNGPGSSGPASVYNGDASPRNTENYYLMIGEEDGWLGLALMLAFFVLVAVQLVRRKSSLALALFASFIGLAVVNFLLPAWTDITLAYIFWGLAAVALAPKTGGAS